MLDLNRWFLVLIPLLYAAAWVNYALLFLREPPLSRRTTRPLLLLAAAIHWTGIVWIALQHRRCPLGNLPEVLSVIAFAVAVVYLVLERRHGNRHTGVFVLALVVPLTIIASATPPGGPPSPLLKSPLFGLHTTMALAGYASFLVCTVYSVMFLLLHHALKRRRFGLVFQRLPALEQLAAMAVGAAVIGFAALTVTMGVGLLWGSRVLRPEQLPAGFWNDPKLWLTFLVWAIYGLALLARTRLRWTHRRTVVLFLTAFVVAVLAVVAVNTILPTFHRFTI